METPGDQHADASELGPDERELTEFLTRRRPVPAAGFRGALGRHLAERDPGYGPRPQHLRAMISAYAGAGAAVMLAGVLQATGTL